MSKKPFIIHDRYFLEAKKLGYRARSVFKLLEIQDKFGILRPTDRVLDLASAPGSFLQAIAKLVRRDIPIVGMDIQRIEPLGHPNVHLLQEDINNFDAIRAFIESLGINEFDVVTSDIAPATTGHTGVDQYRSVELNLACARVADAFLAKGGTLVLKVFVGEDVNDLVGPLKQRYEKLRRYKPHACRDRSFEEYFICTGKKKPPERDPVRLP